MVDSVADIEANYEYVGSDLELEAEIKRLLHFVGTGPILESKISLHNTDRVGTPVELALLALFCESRISTASGPFSTPTTVQIRCWR